MTKCIASLRNARIKAGWAAVINHQMSKEGKLAFRLFEEDIIDVITDILHFAKHHKQLSGQVNVDRVFRCVKSHLHAECSGKED